MLDDPRPGDLTILGDMADEDDDGARRLRETDPRLRGAPHLGHRARRGFDRVGPHRLDRVDDDERRPWPVRQRGDDIVDAGLCRQLYRRAAQTEPGGTEPNLVHRRLAGDVDDAGALPGHRRAGLDQQRGLADARLAAEQQHRAGDESAARHAIELVDSRSEPPLRQLRRVQGAEGEDPALARRPGALGADADGPGILDHRVPGRAGLAAPLPARGDVAAGLADEGRA